MSLLHDTLLLLLLLPLHHLGPCLDTPQFLLSLQLALSPRRSGTFIPIMSSLGYASCCRTVVDTPNPMEYAAPQLNPGFRSIVFVLNSATIPPFSVVEIDVRFQWTSASLCHGGVTMHLVLFPVLGTPDRHVKPAGAILGMTTEEWPTSHTAAASLGKLPPGRP